MANLYNGKYDIFDTSKLKTYSLKCRTSRVSLTDILEPEMVLKKEFNIVEKIKNKIDKVAGEIIKARKKAQPVILFTGAHLVKNGLGLIIIDLIKKGVLTLVAGNGATAIHDFELALFGHTSENTLQALKEHKFGMAYEFNYINAAIILGYKYKIGLGESIGRLICDDSFRNEALSNLINNNDLKIKKFLYPQISISANCYNESIPFTVHVGIGTDVIDQHKYFSGEAKGSCSGKDFLIYTKEVTKLVSGGIVLNVGSAVTGPEVFLKAAAMAANSGTPPNNIITADFDIREEGKNRMTDESSQFYYYRDQKSVVVRIPQAFNGKGYYIFGNQKLTIPYLYKKIIEKL